MTKSAAELRLDDLPDNFNSKFLHKAMLERDLPSLLRFNDHNLIMITKKEQLQQNLAANAVARIHRNSHSVGALHVMMGEFDAALLSV